MIATTRLTCLAGTFAARNRRKLFVNPMSDCRTLIISQIPSTELVLPNPKPGMCSRFDLDRLNLKHDAVAPANLEAIVAVEQCIGAIAPYDQRITAAIVPQALFKLLSFFRTHRRDQTAKFR